jgi:hypothetical protein
MDSAAIDAAVVAYLRGDAALLALLPDGVYLDDAPQDSERYALVRVIEAMDESTFDGRGFELVTYEVAAIGMSRAIDGGTLADAAARIDVVLEGAQVPVSGYPGPATVARIGRLRGAFDLEDDDRSVRWFRRGGVYQVFAPN